MLNLIEWLALEAQESRRPAVSPAPKVRTGLSSVMKKTLSRVGNSEALIITREMKELTGIGHEVEVEIQGNAIVITPTEAAVRPETVDRQARFAAARGRILSEYDEVFRKLADAIRSERRRGRGIAR